MELKKDNQLSILNFFPKVKSIEKADEHSTEKNMNCFQQNELISNSNQDYVKS